MEIRLDYKPNPTQARFHASPATHKCFVGALGTMHINTLIYEADLCRHLPVSWFLKNKKRPSVLSWTPNGWVKIKASMPYFEGVGEMLEVCFESGKKIRVGSAHRFLTQRGFLQARDLLLSDYVVSPRGLFPKFLRDEACALSEKQKALDLKDDCWLDSDLYGEQPLLTQEACQAFWPKQYELFYPKHSYSNDSYRKNRHSKQNYSVVRVLCSLSNLISFDYEYIDELVHYDMEAQGQDESCYTSSPSWKESLSYPALDLKPIPSSCSNFDTISWELLNEQAFFELGPTSPQALLQLKQDILALLASGSKDLLLSSYTCSSAFSKPLQLESSYNDKVKSIESLGVDAYFDIHVPLTNNYVANGLVNHNSGKTTSCAQEIIQCMNEYPGSLWLVGRKFLPALKDSTFRSFMNAVPSELVQDFNKRDLQLTFKNKSQAIFRPLYDPEILKSMEIAGFFIDEANEIDKPIYDRLKDRMRQKLPNGSRPRYQSMIALNPTDEDHWIPQLFLKPPPNHELFQNSTYENLENLPEGYVEELKSIYSEDVLQRFLYGQFGKIHHGRAVYPQFRRGPYIRNVDYVRSLPIIRGWDFGYNHPFCVWMQVIGTQVRVLAECMGKQIYLDDFVNQMVMPRQLELFGDPYAIADYCDPRGSDQSDKGITSVQILNSLGIYPRYRRTTINEGIRYIKGLLDTVKEDTKEPNFLIHPRCVNLIDGLNGGYAREDGKEDPKKDGYYDHGQDALRYACIFVVEKQRFSNIQNLVNNKDNIVVHKYTGYRREFR